MMIEQILTDPELSLQYMERIVNNGSPSNFSFAYTTSKETNPFFCTEFFLCCTKGSANNFIKFGESDYEYFNADLVLLHPDWKSKKTSFPVIDTDILVVPTASSRTVKVVGMDAYIKLCYPGYLGRITRELRTEHILSSIDITNAFMQLIHSDLVPDVFSFFPERCGKVFKQAGGDIGYVIRDGVPVGKQSDRIHALIPAFSLFSKDWQSSDEPLIIQILRQKRNRIEFLLDQLIFPVLDCYFSCVFNGGIQPELHSQNFLIGIDDELNVVSIVLRDLESADKDIEIMAQLNFPFEINSSPFKCISKNQYNYKIKHSFMYDHKLGEYFFDELLNCLHQHNVVSKETMQAIIRTYVNQKYGKKLIDFFPEDKQWYKFRNVLVDRAQNSRPYICFPNPRYR